MMPYINEKISVIICSKDSLEDVKYHLKKVDSYQVGEIIFVTSSEDEIDAVKQNLGKCQTPISLVIDKGTGVGQARAKGLAAVKNEYLIFLGPDNRVDSSAISKIFIQLTTLDFKALAFSQKIFNPRSYFEQCQNFRFKNKFQTLKPLEVIGTPHIINTQDARRIGYDEGVDSCDDTLFFNAFSQLVGPIACSDITAEEKPQGIIKRMAWYGKSDYQFLQTLKERKIKNYVHSFVAETGYIYRERNIFRLCYCFPGLLMMGVTRQMAFMKLILKAIIERRLQRVKKIF